MRILDFLPYGVIYPPQDQILDSITITFDNASDLLSEFIENYQLNLIDPMTIPEELLDWRATGTLSAWKPIWDSDWAVQTKRLLLRDELYIFQRALFPEILTLLFSHFNLTARIQYTEGFILTETLPSALANNIFNYSVVVPSGYVKGTLERALVDFLVETFGSPINVPVILE